MLDDPVLPQRVTRRPADIQSVEWLFEPLWHGDRLMARVRHGRVSLNDGRGDPVDDEFREVADALAPAVAADEAVLDGVWTVQPFVGEGSPARQWAETLEAEGLADEMPDPIAEERRRAFVVLDLVELDGELLHEVPYQERRRLLGGVVEEGVQVRITPAVRMPLTSWMIAWQANGFDACVAKHCNSRYHPGDVNPDWIEMPVTPRTPGMSQRLMGFGRQRKIRIRDR
jgi:bifunctional non-homologous end joining protein LigD